MISHKIRKNYIISIINACEFDDAFIIELNKLYLKYKNYKKVLDITNLTNIDYKFIYFVNKNKIKLINRSSSNFLKLFLTHSDKYVQIYNTEHDLLTNNIIVKRRLKLCS